jgi:hypothetical protein
MKVRFKVRHNDSFWGSCSYFWVLNPTVDVLDRSIVIRGAGGGVVAVIPDSESLIIEEVKPIKE